MKRLAFVLGTVALTVGCTGSDGAESEAEAEAEAEAEFEADIDECLTDNCGCDANATCTHVPGELGNDARTCACNDSYAGDGETCAPRVAFPCWIGEWEPCVTDGTEAGTVLLKVIDGGLWGSSPDNFTTLGALTYFTAKTDALGESLYKTDGTEAGTVMVRDINPGPGDGVHGSYN